jgi:hypothetical protein
MLARPEDLCRLLAYYDFAVSVVIRLHILCSDMQTFRDGREDVKTLWERERQPPHLPNQSLVHDNTGYDGTIGQWDVRDFASTDLQMLELSEAPIVSPEYLRA